MVLSGRQLKSRASGTGACHAGSPGPEHAQLSPSVKLFEVEFSFARLMDC